ncbi:ATP-binding protein [Mucilaginibacter sp. dw_454]|uniref:sensor histidine kinase n=1 Tax=Mucilaginibacter sp. dw_454 TaxID=2720079 RepID=UPI001BD6AF85|nr:ATP-binding protein [Mucilaginibacter sp. dw_454]
MSIKNNLRAGIGFLFLIALLSSGLSAYYLNRLSNETKAFLRDNYGSLVFIENINEVLDIPGAPNDSQLNIIESNIRAEEHNITEPGEKAFADSLRADFNRFNKALQKSLPLDGLRYKMKKSIHGIVRVNMQAIEQKNNKANYTASRAIIIVALIDSFCFFITLLFVIRFPVYITKPIKELNEGIEEISNKNYDKRLLFTSKNEFRSLSEAFNQMAAKLFAYENSSQAKIKQEKLRVETIVKNVTDAIIGFDENELILFINPIAVKLLGVEEKDIIGSTTEEVASQNDLFRTLTDKTEDLNDLKLYLDGELSYFTKELFEIGVPNEDSTEENKSSLKRKGYFILLKNITRFYKLDEAKTNFIATISHELKTPISSLKMSLKLMEDKRYGTVTKFQKELINNINDDSNRLLKITSELLDMGQVETGKLLLNFGSTDPKNIINYTCGAIRFIAEQKEITLNIKCPKNLPEVWADPDKTAWVLINFLTNAIKYSPQSSSIDVTVKKSPLAKVEFSVKDSGKGIDEIYLPRIFERYFKVPGSEFSVPGTGLGLAIAKDFIEAQGGEIGVESKIGEGSRFYFLLPAS